MADEGKGSDKQFEASPQKRAQARRDGNVAQSKEANAFAVICGIIIAALVFKSVSGPWLFREFGAALAQSDSMAADIFEGQGRVTVRRIGGWLLAALPLFVALALPVLAAVLAQRAVSFSLKKIKPDFSRISPLRNAGQRYGGHGLFEFLKDTLKLIFAGVFGGAFLLQFVQAYYASSAVQTSGLMPFAFSQTLKLICVFAAFQLALTVIDVPMQWRMHASKLRMTREDMKKEHKQNEGDPHMKMARREKAAKIAAGQMLPRVETATVVMTNPTHYAVALRWDPDSQKAPVCVAKGADHLAASIRERAIAHGVPIFNDPPSTRSIYSLVDIDAEIRPEHFAAVAAAVQFSERVRAMRGIT
jgi:flagellar biosynthesis protein FlhB